MSGYTRPTMVGNPDPMMEDYPGYNSAPPTWARLRPTRTSNNTVATTDSWSSKPSTQAGVNPTRNPKAPLPRKVLKAKLPGASEATTSSRSTRTSNSSEQWSSSLPPPRALPAVLELTEDESVDFDASETASMSSEVSTSTQATSVASDDTVTAKDGSTVAHRNALRVIRPAPVATVARAKPQLRTRPPADGKTTTVVAPRPPIINRRTVHIQVTPSQEPSDHQKKVEKDLRHKLEQLESETRDLRLEQGRLIKELDSASDRLSTTGAEKDEAEKERNRERDTRQLLYSDLEDQRKILEDLRAKFSEQKGFITIVENERDRARTDLEEQRRILDEFRSNFDLQKGMLLEIEKERDEFRDAKLTFEAKTIKLEKDLKKALEGRKGREGVLVAQVTALELTRDTLETRIDAHTKEILDINMAREESQKKSAEIEAQLKEQIDEKDARFTALVEEKEAQHKKLSEEKDARFSAMIEEKDTQHKILLEEKDTLAGQKETAEEEKAALEARMNEAAQEKEKEMQDLQAKLDEAHENLARLTTELETLTTERASLQDEVEDLQTYKSEHQAIVDSLNVDLVGAQDANIALAAQKIEADAELSKVREELIAVKEEVARLEEVKQALESDKEQLTSNKEQLASNTEHLTSEIEHLTSEVEQLTSENEKLSSDNEKLTSENGTLKSENEDLKSQVEEKAKAEEANDTPVADTTTEASSGSSVSDDKIKELEAEAAKVEGLAAAKAELEAKVAELETEAGKVAGLTSEMALLEAKTAELEQQAGQAATLTEQNSILAAQLAGANSKLAHVQAAHSAAIAQVQDLQSQVAQLRARQPSKSRSNSTSAKRKSTADTKGLVMVRSPSDRGSLQIMRKCDLRPSSPKRSAASATDTEN